MYLQVTTLVEITNHTSTRFLPQALSIIAVSPHRPGWHQQVPFGMASSTLPIECMLAVMDENDMQDFTGSDKGQRFLWPLGHGWPYTKGIDSGNDSSPQLADSWTNKTLMHDPKQQSHLHTESPIVFFHNSPQYPTLCQTPSYMEQYLSPLYWPPCSPTTTTTKWPPICHTLYFCDSPIPINTGSLAMFPHQTDLQTAANS